MLPRRLLLVATLAWSLPVISADVRADHPGQEDLQKAVELKTNPSGEGLQNVTKVIELLGSALDKGLDKDDTEFAEQLLVGSLIERAEALSSLILDRGRPDPRWPQIRAVAVADLERALGLDENQIRGHLVLGRLLALPGGDAERAIEALGKAIDHESTEPEMRAKALLYRGNLQQEDDQRRTDYDRALELAPQDSDILRTRAMFHLGSGRVDEALADLNRALELEPEHGPTYEAKGLALMMQEQYDEALAAFDRAAKLSPESVSPLQNRGRVLALMGDFGKALAALDKAIELNPDAVDAFLLRAQIHYQQGEIQQAVDDLDAILAVRPMALDAIRLKSEILAANDRMEEAIETLRDALSKAPSNLDLAIQLSTYYMVSKRSRRAIELFSQVLEKKPNDFQVLRSRGDAYLNIGKHAEAVRDYEEGIKQDPDDAGLLNNFAWVLATSPKDEIRDGKRAIELAQRACALTDYQRPHILSTLAAGYAETGDFKMAIEWSSKAVEIGDEEHDDQLRQELESYQQGNPWRELMEEEEAAEKDAADVKQPGIPPAQSSDF